jgi:hypothetical protein
MSEVKQPFFDIVALVVAMAFLDEAFESNIRSMEDIYASRVEPPRHSLQLRFVKEKHNVPICRQPISTYCGISTHEIKPLKYHTYLYYLERLSLVVGMPRAMKPYDLRCGTGEAVESKFRHSVNKKALKLICELCSETAPLPLLQ